MTDLSPLGVYVVELRYKGNVCLVWQLVERSLGDVLEKVAELTRDDGELAQEASPSEPPITIDIRRVK